MVGVTGFGVVCEWDDDSARARDDDHSRVARAAAVIERPKRERWSWRSGGPGVVYGPFDPSDGSWIQRLLGGVLSPLLGFGPSGVPWYRRAWHAHRERRMERISLRYIEFADLSDGRRVILREDRGTGWSYKTKEDPWRGRTREDLIDDARDTIDQYEEDRPCSPEWVVERLKRLYDIEVDPASVRAAQQKPRLSELGSRLQAAVPH